MKPCIWILIASLGCGASSGTLGPDDGPGGAGPSAGSDGAAATGGRGGGASGQGGTGGADGEAGSDGGAADDAGDAAGARDADPILAPICVRDGDPSARYCDLTIRGEGFEQFEGKLVDVRNGTPPFQRIGSGQTRVVGGRFSITLPQVQELATIYKLTVVRFDANGDGVCSPGDQMFTSGAPSFTIADGGAYGCPAFVPLDEGVLLRIVAAGYCADGADPCGAEDGGT